MAKIKGWKKRSKNSYYNSKRKETLKIQPKPAPYRSAFNLYQAQLCKKGRCREIAPDLRLPSIRKKTIEYMREHP